MTISLNTLSSLLAIVCTSVTGRIYISEKVLDIALNFNRVMISNSYVE